MFSQLVLSELGAATNDAGDGYGDHLDCRSHTVIAAFITDVIVDARDFRQRHDVGVADAA